KFVPGPLLASTTNVCAAAAAPMPSNATADRRRTPMAGTISGPAGPDPDRSFPLETSRVRDILIQPMATAVQHLTTALKLLSDPTRLRLCTLLAQRELAVQELVAVTGLQQSRISNHLALLKRAGLVRDRREGTWSFHSLVEPGERGPLTPE